MPALQPLTQTQHAPQRSPHSLDNFTFDFRPCYRRADGKPFHMDWYINPSPPAIPTQRNTLGPPSTKQSPPPPNQSLRPSNNAQSSCPLQLAPRTNQQPHGRIQGSRREHVRPGLPQGVQNTELEA